MAKWLIIIGLVLVVLGLLLHYVPWTLNWFGKLPGDIHKELENGGLYIPITSMIIISILITVILNLFKH
ncbi:MAG: DUF2905 domain-containing protein [Gammaproteobacteria bacterium]|nr:DUF2905 domain-containing protein [Gammaproteobacteria bacterium]MCW8988661.1 DUF2905 domain-containing protein [Gammaproteobacteria bacterium]